LRYIGVVQQFGKIRQPEVVECERMSHTSDGESFSSWEGLQQLHHQVQEMADRYVENLSKEKTFLEQHAAFLTAMLESVGDGLIVCDATGRTMLVNQAADKIVGADIGVSIEQPFVDEKYGLFYSETSGHIAAADQPLRKAIQGKTTEGTYFGRASKFPQGRWFRVHATPVVDRAGSILGAVAVFHDISDQNRLTRQRDALAALVTHDLKSHLLGERRLFEMLLEGSLGELSETQKKIVRQLNDDSQRQYEMTSNLMEIYRYDVKAQALHFEDVDLKPILQQSLNDAIAAAADRDLTFEQTISKKLRLVCADPRALAHVLNNLIGNAMKYTPAGGRISVEADNVENDVVIKVIDGGPGIPLEEQELLFVDAWQGEANYKTAGGTGLGLYLCGKVIAAHGGKIACVSEVGVGTTITVTLTSLNA
jgi:PAS domain S-box-containing protein